MVANVTGWNELINGSIFMATTVLFQSYYGDWYITLLFLSFKIMLYMATRSAPLGFFTSMVFMGVFISEINLTLQATVVSIAIVELAMLLYSAIYKK